MIERMQKNYLAAAGSSVFAALLAVVLYPDKHGLGSRGGTGFIMFMIIMVSLFVWVVIKAKRSGEIEMPHEGADRAERLKKMILLWSGFALLLSSTLIRYPIIERVNGVSLFSPKSFISITAGIVVFVYSLIKIITTFRIKVDGKL
jgi:uncharacterized protein YqhQ